MSTLAQISKKFIYNAGVEATREYMDSSPVLKRRPRPKLVVNPFIPPFVPVELLSADIGGLILNYDYSKDRQNPGGQFNIVLAADDSEIERIFRRLGIVGEIFRRIWKSFGSSLRDIFKPHTMAQFWLDDYHIMTGYLRSAKRGVAANGKKTFSLHFDELGNMFNENILSPQFLAVAESIFIVQNPQNALKAAAVLPGMDLSTALFMLTNAFTLSTLSQNPIFPFWNLSDGLPMSHRFISLPAPLGGIANLSMTRNSVSGLQMFMDNAGGSFWSFLKGIVKEPFMEMFCETGGRTAVVGRLASANAAKTFGLHAQIFAQGGDPFALAAGLDVSIMLPGFNYLIARSMPYDNPLIGFGPYYAQTYPFQMGVFDLIMGGDFVILTDRDIISKDIGTSDYDQHTIFEQVLTGGASGPDGQSRPSVARGPLNPLFPGGLRTHGVKYRRDDWNAVSIGWEGLISQVLERFAKKLGIPGISFGVQPISSMHNVYFRNQSKFLEGSFECRPLPYARPGMALLYLPDYESHRIEDKREAGVYYIDSISARGGSGKAGNISLNVIRGTPIPLSGGNALSLLMDWDIFPPGFNLTDYGV